MLELHPKFLEKDGMKEFAVLTYSEYMLIQDALEDYYDILELRKAKNDEENNKSYSLAEAAELLGI